MKVKLCLAAGIAGAVAASAAIAQITVGVSVAYTGPQASLGLHYKNA